MAHRSRTNLCSKDGFNGSRRSRPSLDPTTEAFALQLSISWLRAEAARLYCCVDITLRIILRPPRLAEAGAFSCPGFISSGLRQRESRESFLSRDGLKRPLLSNSFLLATISA